MQSTAAVTDDVTNEVQALVREFSIEVTSADHDMLESGILDSANLVRLLAAMETRFGVTIPMEEVDIDSLRTVARIADLVRRRKTAEAARPLNMAEARHPCDAAGERPPMPEEPNTRARDLIQQIRELFRESLFADVSSDDEDLFRAGILDSMGLVHLITSVENRFGLTISLDELDVAAFRTMKGIARLVLQLAGGDTAANQAGEEPR